MASMLSSHLMTAWSMQLRIISAISFPGGSIRDNEVIATANRLGVALVFTGMQHFLH